MLKHNVPDFPLIFDLLTSQAVGDDWFSSTAEIIDSYIEQMASAEQPETKDYSYIWTTIVKKSTCMPYSVPDRLMHVNYILRERIFSP